MAKSRKDQKIVLINLGSDDDLEESIKNKVSSESFDDVDKEYGKLVKRPLHNKRAQSAQKWEETIISTHKEISETKIGTDSFTKEELLKISGVKDTEFSIFIMKYNRYLRSNSEWILVKKRKKGLVVYNKTKFSD